MGQHSALWPVMSISMVLITMYRFSEDEALTDKGAKNLMIGALLAPEGGQARVLFFWACVLLVLTYVTYRCRPAHIHGTSHLLIPEIVVLGLFFLADFSIELYRTVDTNGDMILTLCELQASPLLVAGILPARWMMANFCMVLAATIVQTISPEPYTKESFVYSICWSLVLSQAVSQFLFSSNRRGEDLHGWDDGTFAAVIYGPSLYFYTHGMALVIAVVFHKHKGATHPPTLIKVAKVLAKADPMYVLQMVIFVAAVVAANVLPPVLDHGCESWLEACTKGLYAGPLTVLTQSAINAVALMVAYNVSRRKVDIPPRPSYESALVWTTGCMATFIWCELAVPGKGSLLKFAGVLLGAASHYIITGVSADAFSERMETNIKEAVVMLFWASTQCFQGLALEHHGATSHHGHGGLSVHGLLNHLGEFGLCEFGLIATLAWATKITEEIVTLPQKGAVGGLRKPLLGK